jgi:hypothetical protein
MVLSLGISALVAWVWYGRRSSVQKQVVSAVNQKAEVRQKVHTDDWSCDVGHDKPPREVLVKPQVQAER